MMGAQELSIVASCALVAVLLFQWRVIFSWSAIGGMGSTVVFIYSVFVIS